MGIVLLMMVHNQAGEVGRVEDWTQVWHFDVDFLLLDVVRMGVVIAWMHI